MGKAAVIATVAVCVLSLASAMLGVAFIWFGIHGARDNRAFMGRAIRVPGTITGTASHTYGGDWRLFTFSRFRFKTLDGRIVSRVDEFPDSYHLGGRISVVYDPQNPRAVYMNHLPPWSWKTTVICILAGVFFLGVGGGPPVLALVRCGIRHSVPS
jgi:hypothetical protein